MKQAPALQNEKHTKRKPWCKVNGGRKTPEEIVLELVLKKWKIISRVMCQ